MLVVETNAYHYRSPRRTHHHMRDYDSQQREQPALTDRKRTIRRFPKCHFLTCAAQAAFQILSSNLAKIYLLSTVLQVLTTSEPIFPCWMLRSSSFGSFWRSAAYGCRPWRADLRYLFLVAIGCHNIKVVIFLSGGRTNFRCRSGAALFRTSCSCLVLLCLGEAELLEDLGCLVAVRR